MLLWRRPSCCLPVKEDQDILLNAARETASYQRKLGRDNEEKQIGELAAKGTVVIRDIDKALNPVIKEHQAAFGKDRIEGIVNVQ